MRNKSPAVAVPFYGKRPDVTKFSDAMVTCTSQMNSQRNGIQDPKGASSFGTVCLEKDSASPIIERRKELH